MKTKQSLSEIKMLTKLQLKKGNKYIIFISERLSQETYDRFFFALERLGISRSDIVFALGIDGSKVRVAEIVEKKSKPNIMKQNSNSLETEGEVEAVWDHALPEERFEITSAYKKKSNKKKLKGEERFDNPGDNVYGRSKPLIDRKQLYKTLLLDKPIKRIKGFMTPKDKKKLGKVTPRLKKMQLYEF